MFAKRSSTFTSLVAHPRALRHTARTEGQLSLFQVLRQQSQLLYPSSTAFIFCSINVATCFGFQQAIIRLCKRKQNDKTLQLNSIVTQGLHPILFTDVRDINNKKPKNVAGVIPLKYKFCSTAKTRGFIALMFTKQRNESTNRRMMIISSDFDIAPRSLLHFRKHGWRKSVESPSCGLKS
jgi:hypothetical protein